MLGSTLEVGTLRPGPRLEGFFLLVPIDGEMLAGEGKGGVGDDQDVLLL